MTDTDDMAALLYFLLGAVRAGDRYNARTANEAFDAACRLCGLDPARTMLHISGIVTAGGVPDA